ISFSSKISRLQIVAYVSVRISGGSSDRSLSAQFWTISQANIGPEWSDQKRTDSWQMSMPRS
ncbi:hypothetical protein, partial [Thioclava sp. F36-7]|uniref:hypothetical protein n=1 Tax=Thioclava sp. F36-7 TaxID=1915317 RepID=UPI001AEF49D1